MKSTFLKSLILVFVIFVVIISVFLIILASSIKSTMLSQFTESLKNLSMIAEPNCILLIQNNDGNETQKTIERMGKSLGIRATLVDTAGVVLADSDHDPKLMDNHLERPEIQEARDKGHGKSIRFSHTLDTDFLYVAKRLSDHGTIGYVRFSMPLTAIQAFQRDLRKWIAIAGIALLVIAAAVVYLYSLYLRKPVKDIRNFTAELSSGDFSARLLKPAKGDIAEVYNDLNRMVEKLEESFKTISKERDILTGVLAAMTDGVCLVDRDWQIINCNKSFERMFFLTENPLTKNLWDVIRHNAFLDLIEKCRTDKNHKTIELNLQDKGKILMVNSFHILSFSGWAFVFTDVTETKNLEKIKADFVTNLSHELRTPLTAIKGYLETIDDPDIAADDRSKFLNIVRENTERLISIVADLLTLADFERSKRATEHVQFDLNKLAADVVLLFKKEAGAKQLKLLFEPGTIPQFTGDRFMIQQLLLNLISNGIRFTEKGEVRIDIDHHDNMFVISVSDTGIGIPDEEIPRIFERFYTVDKARSRAHGGTGLGLAIVKHIVQAHGGQITVESRLGEGTKFKVVLPAAPK